MSPHKPKELHIPAAHSLSSECLPSADSPHRYHLCMACHPPSVCVFSSALFIWSRTILPSVTLIPLELSCSVLATQPSINTVPRTSLLLPSMFRTAPNLNWRSRKCTRETRSEWSNGSIWEIIRRGPDLSRQDLRENPSLVCLPSFS